MQRKRNWGVMAILIRNKVNLNPKRIKQIKEGPYIMI